MLGKAIFNSSFDNKLSSTPDLERISISAAAILLLSANFPTSTATTPNPFPCSPARAASTAAFNARIFV